MDNVLYMSVSVACKSNSVVLNSQKSLVRVPKGVSNGHNGAIHLQASSEAEADSTGLGTGLVFQASLSAWYFRPIQCSRPVLPASELA